MQVADFESTDNKALQVCSVRLPTCGFPQEHTNCVLLLGAIVWCVGTTNTLSLSIHAPGQAALAQQLQPASTDMLAMQASTAISKGPTQAP